MTDAVWFKELIARPFPVVLEPVAMLPQQPQQPHKPMKIMKRKGPRKSSDADAGNAAAKGSRQLTLEEKQAAYDKRRAEIFKDDGTTDPNAQPQPNKPQTNKQQSKRNSGGRSNNYDPQYSRNLPARGPQRPMMGHQMDPYGYQDPSMYANMPQVCLTRRHSPPNLPQPSALSCGVIDETIWGILP